MKDRSLGRIGVEMNVVSSSCRVPSEELKLLDVGSVSRVSKEVVSGELHLWNRTDAEGKEREGEEVSFDSIDVRPIFQRSEQPERKSKQYLHPQVSHPV